MTYEEKTKGKIYAVTILSLMTVMLGGFSFLHSINDQTETEDIIEMTPLILSPEKSVVSGQDDRNELSIKTHRNLYDHYRKWVNNSTGNVNYTGVRTHADCRQLKIDKSPGFSSNQGQWDVWYLDVGYFTDNSSFRSSYETNVKYRDGIIKAFSDNCVNDFGWTWHKTSFEPNYEDVKKIKRGDVNQYDRSVLADYYYYVEEDVLAEHVALRIPANYHVGVRNQNDCMGFLRDVNKNKRDVNRLDNGFKLLLWNNYKFDYEFACPNGTYAPPSERMPRRTTNPPVNVTTPSVNATPTPSVNASAPSIDYPANVLSEINAKKNLIRLTNDSIQKLWQAEMALGNFQGSVEDVDVSLAHVNELDIDEANGLKTQLERVKTILEEVEKIKLFILYEPLDNLASDLCYEANQINKTLAKHSNVSVDNLQSYPHAFPVTDRIGCRGGTLVTLTNGPFCING